MVTVLTPWIRCEDCGKIVKINKPLFGSLHLCLSREEREAKRLAEKRQRRMGERHAQQVRGILSGQQRS